MIVTFIQSQCIFWTHLIKFPIAFKNLVSLFISLFLFHLSSQAQLNTQWATMSGGPASEDNQSVAVDIEGNVYVVGKSGIFIDFGNGISLESPAGYIVKYNPNGIAQWARTLEGAIHDIAVDPAGNVFVSGSFNQPVLKVGIIKSIKHSKDGDADYFLVKYDTEGTALWGESIRSLTNFNTLNSSIAVDNAGNVHLTGNFEGQYYVLGSEQKHILTYNEKQPVKVTYSGFTDIFVIKYNTKGVYQWAKSIGGTKDDLTKEIALDPEGNIYLAAYSESNSMQYYDATNNSISILKRSSEFPISIKTKENTYLIKLNTNGEKIMEKNFDVDYGSHTNISLGVDKNQNVYMMGSKFSGSINFGKDLFGNSITLNSSYDGDSYIVKFSNKNRPVWAKLITKGSDVASAGHLATSIAVDAMGNFYLTGYFYIAESGEFNLDFGNDVYASLEIPFETLEEQTFLVQYNSHGQALWANAYGEPLGTFDYDQGTDVKVDHENNVYLVGNARTSPDDAIDFGDGILATPVYIDPVTGDGERDMFVVKFSNPNASSSNQYPFGIGYEIVSDAGAHPISEIDATESNGLLEKGLTLYDIGDFVRYNFNIVESGFYKIRARLRSGDIVDQTSFWPNGYAFTVNGNIETFSGILESTEHYPSFIGNAWFGYMESEAIYLEEGLQELTVEAMQAWAALDYFEVISTTETEASLVYHKNVESVKVYPNPILANQSTITLESQFSVKDIQILSMEGNGISNEVSSIEVFSNTVKINIKYPGLYFARIFLDNGDSITKRLLVR